MKGQIINNKWEYLKPLDTDISEVVYDTARSKIKRNVLSFLNNSDLFASKGLSKSRDLLYGSQEREKP